jgi:hypothetical protein
MNFLAKLLRGIAFVPAIVHGIEALFGSKSGNDNGIEALFGSKSGNDKKEAALSFVGAALSVTEAIANRDIVDDAKFRDGLGKIIDGVVQCLNASAWAK